MFRQHSDLGLYPLMIQRVAPRDALMFLMWLRKRLIGDTSRHFKTQPLHLTHTLTIQRMIHEQKWTLTYHNHNQTKKDDPLCDPATSGSRLNSQKYWLKTDLQSNTHSRYILKYSQFLICFLNLPVLPCLSDRLTSACFRLWSMPYVLDLFATVLHQLSKYEIGPMDLFANRLNT